MNAFKSLKKCSISKEVESVIINAITNNVYKPGEKLPSERDLVKQFQVSRVTIREALKKLEKDGFITIKRGAEGGAYICELNPEPIINIFNNLISLGKVDIPHLIHARICIEPQISMTAAYIRTNEEVQSLTKLVEKSEKLISTSLTKARLMNLNFHFEISKIMNNPIVSFITESVAHNFNKSLIKITKGKITKKDIADTIQEHKEILNAIKEKKTIEAHNKTLNHLLKHYDKIIKIFPDVKNDKVDKCINSYRDMGTF